MEAGGSSAVFQVHSRGTYAQGEPGFDPGRSAGAEQPQEAGGERVQAAQRLPGIRADVRVFPLDPDFPGGPGNSTGKDVSGDGLDLSDSVHQGLVESAGVPKEGAEDLLQGVGIEEILEGPLEMG
jgi:hypothetical protein